MVLTVRLILIPGSIVLSAALQQVQLDALGQRIDQPPAISVTATNINESTESATFTVVASLDSVLPSEADVLQSLPYKSGIPALNTLPRPRVFLYDVPDRYHENVVSRFLPGIAALLDDQDTTGPAPHLSSLNTTVAWTNSEIGIQRCLAQEPARPMQPEEADFFYVPLYPSMCTIAQFAPTLFDKLDADVCTLIDFASRTLDEISRPLADSPAQRLAAGEPGMQAALDELGLGKLPELWERAGGRDHIFPAAAEMKYAQEDSLMGSPIRLLPDFGLTQKPDATIDPNSEYMIKFGYAQSKDLLFPWHFYREEVEAPGIQAERPHFIYFAASMKTMVSSANSLRGTLAALVAGESDGLFVEMTARFPPADLMQRMGESVFCLAPPGDTQLTTRHYDAILMGCIPVILTEGTIPLPFDNILDWSKFAILLPTTSALDGTLLQILRAKSHVELQELRNTIYAVRPYFRITPNCTSPSGLDMFLHQLALQRASDPVLNSTASHPSLVSLPNSSDNIAVNG